MINRSEILQTIAMIDQQHLDIRTITMGISLLDCADTDITRSCTKVYDKICRLAGRLVRTGEDIEAEFGIPIVNKRVSVTPISLVAAGTGARSYVPYGPGWYEYYLHGFVERPDNLALFMRSLLGKR